MARVPWAVPGRAQRRVALSIVGTSRDTAVGVWEVACSRTFLWKRSGLRSSRLSLIGNARTTKLDLSENYWGLRVSSRASTALRARVVVPGPAAGGR